MPGVWHRVLLVHVLLVQVLQQPSPLCAEFMLRLLSETRVYEQQTL